MKDETRFRVNQVNPFLKKLKSTYFKSIQQISKSGDSDVILCILGYFIALELKAAHGLPSKLQDSKLDDVQAAHGVSLVASPLNWDEVKTLLLKFSRGEITHDTIRTESKLLRSNFTQLHASFIQNCKHSNKRTKSLRNQKNVLRIQESEEADSGALREGSGREIC